MCAHYMFVSASPDCHLSFCKSDCKLFNSLENGRRGLPVFGLVVCANVCFLDDVLLFNRMLHSSGLMDVRTPAAGIIMRNFSELFASIYISGFSDASPSICNFVYVIGTL